YGGHTRFPGYNEIGNCATTHFAAFKRSTLSAGRRKNGRLTFLDLWFNRRRVSTRPPLVSHLVVSRFARASPRSFPRDCRRQFRACRLTEELNEAYRKYRDLESAPSDSFAARRHPGADCPALGVHGGPGRLRG